MEQMIEPFVIKGDDYSDELYHYGTKEHSGRYPWGSGEDPFQRLGGRDSFLQRSHDLRSQGLSDAETAKALGLTTSEYRAKRAVATSEARGEKIDQARKLKDKGWSTAAIGRKMGINESSVRSLLEPTREARANASMKIADSIEKTIGKSGCMDVGKGVERYLGVSPEKLKAAVQILKDRGYKTMVLHKEQLGTGESTKINLISTPDLTARDIHNDSSKIKSVAMPIDESGEAKSVGIRPPVSVSSDRVAIRYAEDGGIDKDGVMEINPSAVDIHLGNKRYAQVRIQVGEKSYLKGMAMYGDPKEFKNGVDIIFNTNKGKDKSKEQVLKECNLDSDGKVDTKNPFGAVIKRQLDYIDPKDGKKKQSPVNIVNEEGDWDSWSRSLASQMLSKQEPKLARQQLGIQLDRERMEFNEIKNLTNPVVKKKLLEDFAGQCDSNAVHLKAASLPRQRTQAILPITSLKDNEIYAPHFRNGETVVLIRYPHGGIFEIPTLKVNNRNKEGKRYLGNALDAVGINSHVAERLSGADFDGDNVLVIPNNHGEIKTAKALSSLKDFDPKAAYPEFNGMKRMTKQQRGIEMGKVSNLITDMTIQGASPDELARAVRHSMVVIDAYKHHLDYKQSEQDNRIQELKDIYQPKGNGKKGGGPHTLISRSTSDIYIPERKLRPAKEGGSIDPKTGKLIYVNTDANSIITKHNPDGSVKSEKVIPKVMKVSKMSYTDDARKLSSGTVMENIYADYANHAKALANEARKEMMATPDFKADPEAKKRYSREVASIKAKLNVALKNAPRERMAQVVANDIYNQRKSTYDPDDLDKDTLKKLRNAALREARERMGAHKQNVVISDKEWEAIQHHAVSATVLKDILNNSDTDRLRELATPKQGISIPTYVMARAKSLVKSGYTYSEVAQSLGISESSVSKAVKE